MARAPRAHVPGAVFADTSFWFAALDPADVNHERAGELLESARSRHTLFHSTREVISESLTLLRYRSGARTALTFADRVLPTLEIAPADERAHANALEVFRRLARRRRLSYCDALSFVIVRTVLDDVPCLAFDRNFRALGLTVIA
jgi:predicted nucleic acid-binding protein